MTKKGCYPVYMMKNTTKQTRKNLQAMADKNGFIYKPGRKTPLLKIWKDGSINRADVRLDLCTNLKVSEAYMLLK